MLTTLYNQEFTESASPVGKLENGMSVEDVKFMKILEDGANMVNKPYQNPLPFRYQEWLRLLYLQKRTNRNKEFENNYVRFMQEISKRYARKSTKEGAPGKIWYLPQYDVCPPNKPVKVRAVFDLSADYKDRCINKELLSRPDLTNQIVGVLLQFREDKWQ